MQKIGIAKSVEPCKLVFIRKKMRQKKTMSQSQKNRKNRTKGKLREILFSRLVKSIGVYTVSNIMTKAIPFFLLPVMTRYLTPSDYGVVSMFAVVLSLVIPFSGLQLEGAIERVYFDSESKSTESYSFNALILMLVSSLVTGVVFFISVKLIRDATSIPVSILWMVPIVALLESMNRIVLSMFRVRNRAKQYGLYNIFKTLFNAVISVLLVVCLKLGGQGRIIGELSSVFIMTCVGFAIIQKNQWIKVDYNQSYIKHALKFGLPLIPHVIGSVAISMTDRIFITSMIGIEATGIYAVGHQIGVIINTLTVSFNTAYTPWLYSKLKESSANSKERIVRITYLYYVGVLILAVLLSLLIPFLGPLLVGGRFSASLDFVFWIAIGYAFNGMYFMVTNYLFFAERTSLLALVTFTTAVLNIPLNYVFITLFGAIGAAQATSIIYLIKFILTWVMATKVYKMPWNLKRGDTNLAN